MEGTKPRTANSLGMFDFLKGIGMLTIVFAHSAELYPVGATTTITPMTFYLFAYRESLMAAFYIASGYGFRKRPSASASTSSSKRCSSPTFIPGLPRRSSIFSSTISPSARSRALSERPSRSSAVCVWACPIPPSTPADLLLLRTDVVSALADDRVDSAGRHPEHLPRTIHTLAVLGTMLLGWGICITWEVPFCIGQGMVTVPALYVGYLAKQHKLFDKPLSWSSSSA